jgi:hypothetical protein
VALVTYYSITVVNSFKVKAPGLKSLQGTDTLATSISKKKGLFFNIDDFNNFQGIEFETFPSALSLAAMSGPHKVSLVGVPKGTGILKILGYTCTVLGVKSTCKLAR